MAIAFVDRTTKAGGTTSDNKIVANAGNHITNNGLIVLIDIIGTGETITGITDTAGNQSVGAGYIQLATLNDGGMFNRYDIWYHSNITGNASNVVQANMSGSTGYRAIVVYQVSGQDTSGMADTSKTGAGTSASIASASFTVTGTMLIAAIGSCLSPPVTAAGSYTVYNFDLDGSTAYYFTEHHVTTSNETAQATQNASNTYAILAGSFKSAPAGGTPLFRKSELAGIGAGGKFFQNPLSAKGFIKRNHIYVPERYSRPNPQACISLR